MTRRVFSIQRKLNELIRCDPRKSIFGAAGPHGHGYRRRQALRQQELQELEADIGVGLPRELQLFLTEVHGGGAGPGYGMFVEPDPKPSRRHARLFPFDNAMAQRTIKARLQGTDRWASLELPEDADDDDNWPPGPGFLPVAHHGCGVYDVIATVGEQRGKMWCCDMTWCPHFDEHGTGVGLLQWYETWLDASLRKVGRLTAP